MLSALAADRARVAELDAKISLLERQRAQVQARLDSYRYPVLTLPNEIITEIFVHFLPPYPHCISFHKLYGLIVLTQICHLWREIALRTPALWRAIGFYPLADHPALFDAWLGRARGFPISLIFDTDWIEDNRAAGSLKAIVPYLAQLEYFEVHWGSLSQLQAIEGPMPMLRHFELLLQEEDDPPTPVSFLEAPLLRRVLLNGAAVGNVILPWAQLTSLALDGVFLSECASILQQTFNLVHCELIFVGGDLDDEDAPDVTPVLTITGIDSLQ
ncbi:F-box domain-containing protein [Mycena sanguinolenta]|uniref:F-box domain-containing protein n=1 Tax=Mycena sanguinolenta TaxID=230812 RepID=A0A8H7DAP7_9AGAR|nr:F-box domain-containing protein [Mycena sanguinolenta]